MPAPKSFAKKMRAWSDDIKKQANEIKVQLAIETLTQVHGDTPVDTGRAKDGWVMSQGAPDRTFTPQGPYAASRHVGTKGQRRENRTAQKGQRARMATGAITRNYPQIRGAAFGVALYINNNLSYIGALNNGHSKQAPKNFFRIAVNRARGILRRQVIRYVR